MSDEPPLLFAVIEEERHSDIWVVVFQDCGEAIAYAKDRASDYDLAEESVEGWEWNATDESRDYAIRVEGVWFYEKAED